MGITKSKYLEICTQLNEEVDFEKMPPEFEDFPYGVQVAFDLYGKLSDRYLSGMSAMYIGKDLSTLPVLFEIYEVAKPDHKLVTDTILYIDNRARLKAQRRAEKEAKKAAKK